MNDPFYDLLPFLFCTLMLMGAVGAALCASAGRLEGWLNK